MIGVRVYVIACAATLACGVSAPAVETELSKAIAGDERHRVSLILSESPDELNSADERGRTPLHLALMHQHDSLAIMLVERGADVNALDSSGESPLHYAARAGSTAAAQYLLDHGTTTLNTQSAAIHGGFAGGWTPLHVAVREGRVQVVRLLLDRGADIEARDGAQRTPLILSAESNTMDVVRLLVEREANINVTAIRGFTALLWASRNRFSDMVDYLVARGASIDSAMVNTALQQAAVHGQSSLYEYALSLGADLETIRTNDPGLLFPACSGGSVAIVRSLTEHGFDLHQVDPDGWTPLHYAASEGHTAVVDYLVTAGIAIDHRTACGETAFNLAQQQTFPETADLLRTLGADTAEQIFPHLSGPYMGQHPPGDTPELFLPGIVSGHHRAHSSIAFSPDGTEAYWTEMSPPEGAVRMSRQIDGRWSYPVKADSGIERDPSFSPDGARMFFISTRPFAPGEVPGGDPDVKEEYWYRERTEAGWSDPRPVGENINRLGVHWPCSADKHGNLYFSEFSENMYCSELRDGTYQEPVLLTRYLGNETLVGHSPYISPEADFLIFSAEDGLKISFRCPEGSWTDCINLGDSINGTHVNGSPRITPDGQYMFFLSAGRQRPWGIYWVSAAFIDRLRAKACPSE